MFITHFHVSPYQIPFQSPVSIKGQLWPVREGFFVTLEGDGIIKGIGDVAPLPGISAETLQEVHQQLMLLEPVLSQQEIPPEAQYLNGAFTQWFDGLSLCPCVCFGIEMAVLNLIAQAKKIPLHKLIGPRAHDRIAVSGLLQGTKETVVKQAKSLITEGFSSIKLKVSGDIKESAEKVVAVYRVLSDQALLHLDVNQAWGLAEALEFAAILEHNGVFISYIEEPLRDITHIPEFFHKTNLPVGLDESLLGRSFQEIQSIEGVELIILKPTLLGGIEKTWQLVQKAQRLGIHPVISSSFESLHGLWTLAAIAANLNHHSHAGLDTYKYFKDKDKDPLCRGVWDLNAY